ncbi:UPF0669 protein v1g209471-like [Neocloeon triangulifer]|uniref:UPF0669 protein v1g209471-like n=1 Tax=Neocloeon triangulifer TaxID=2078957 RepID=UPI00286F5686|nr:UPF0669 protein v1g209471-like [Neocloeon triangulifer]
MRQVLLAVLVAAVLDSVRSEVRLHSVAGEVGRGNFTYYSLMYDGPISLILHSNRGDCDLYVSQHNSKPTYEPHTYCLHSNTCGLDRVDIPELFKRPVGVGVYGHPSHEVCEYLLEVQLERGEFGDDPRVSYEPQETTGHQEEQSLLWGIIVSVAELLLEGLLL